MMLTELYFILYYKNDNVSFLKPSNLLMSEICSKYCFPVFAGKLPKIFFKSLLMVKKITVAKFGKNVLIIALKDLHKNEKERSEHQKTVCFHLTYRHK